MTKIKMCGLFRDEDIDAANKVKPDYIGFVFYKKSHRYVDLSTAERFKSRLDGSIKAVGVFVDEDIFFIKELVDKKIIDLIQLHGNEDESYISNLRQMLGKSDVPIIKALVIRTQDDIHKLSGFFSSSDSGNDTGVDFLLLDSGMGSGSSFDWNLIHELQKPMFLAGGLNEQNVAEAIDKVHPYAVDVSSGIETDRVKDIDKMKNFKYLVTNADM